MRGSLGPFGGREAALIVLSRCGKFGKKVAPKEGIQRIVTAPGKLKTEILGHAKRIDPASAGNGASLSHSAGDFGHHLAKIIVVTDSTLHRLFLEKGSFASACGEKRPIILFDHGVQAILTGVREMCEPAAPRKDPSRPRISERSSRGCQ
jgi:hypothetical protein